MKRFALLLIGVALAGCTSARALDPTPTPTVQPTATPGYSPGYATSAQVLLEMPNSALSVDIAAHAEEGWPALAAIDAPLTNDGAPHPFVRVFNPQLRVWSTAQSLDIGPSAIGRHRFRSVALAIAADRAVVAVWGASAAPEHGLWSSSSRNFGATWSAPERLMAGAFGVLDVVATPDGGVAALAVQREPLAPVLLVRDAAGAWAAPEPIPAPSAWYGSVGALVCIGDGPAAHLVALISTDHSLPGGLFLAERPLGGGPWQVQERRVPGALQPLNHARGGDWSRIDTAGQTGAIASFTVGTYESAELYALVSADGRSWGQPELLPRDPAAAAGGAFAAPIYDASTDQLFALWTCCADARYENVPATHYAARRDPDGAWRTGEGPAAPLLTGAIMAGDTATAQASASRAAWLAWAEGGNRVMVRSIALDQLVPQGAEP